MTQNKIEVDNLIKRLSVSEKKEGGHNNGAQVSTTYFGSFLKNKIDKRRDPYELIRFANMMDIDRDGFIDRHDLGACLGNLTNDTFFANNGERLAISAGFSKMSDVSESEAAWFPKEKMSLQKTAEVVKQIKDALIRQQVSFHAFFKKIDTNNNGMLSFSEFSTGVDQIVKLSPMVKEQLFARMDVNNIGMVDYESFLETL